MTKLNKPIKDITVRKLHDYFEGDTNLLKSLIDKIRGNRIGNYTLTTLDPAELLLKDAPNDTLGFNRDGTLCLFAVDNNLKVFSILAIADQKPYEKGSVWN